MTLQQTMDALCQIAKSQPNIHTTITNDIYRLDAMPNVKYSVFGITQNVHSWDDNLFYVNLNLYFIDRLTSDSKNELAIQSHAIEVLKNIIKTFKDEYDAEIYNGIVEFRTFTQKFCDLTAGAYATLRLAVDAETDCYESF